MSNSRNNRNFTIYYFSYYLFIIKRPQIFDASSTTCNYYHIYFRKIDLTPGSRPLVISEFGGYACKLPGYYYGGKRDFGYRKCPDRTALQKDIERLYQEEIEPLKAKGLSAAIYTQLSDVEDETNGLLTYDREVKKVDSVV